MIITTTPSVEGRAIREYKGIAFGEVITGVNVIKDLGAGLRNFFGGRSAGYEEELQKAREEALKELEQRAAAMGANAVIGVDIAWRRQWHADGYSKRNSGSGGLRRMAAVKNGREYLTHVTETLRHRITQLNDSIEAGQKEIEGMHEYYWENYTEMDQYGYEDFDNQQALLGQVNANKEKLDLRRRFKKMLDSPFFGRVDFIYDGEEEAETFYIGIGNFSKESGRLPLVYDWRAPVSSLFYDYDKGEAYYDAPAGRMEGEVLSKWQYKIRGGKMIYAFESDVKIDDEVLKQELGSHGDVKLKNIIKTIQKEQNAIIRNTQDRILAIQGVAGSGKTSVALHRIAYLLYHDRENLKSSNVLVLSPNGVFSDYISHILPELGEENIREMSFDMFAYRELRDTVSDCEDRCDQIEKELLDEKYAESCRKKQSIDFVLQLNEFVLGLEDRLMRFSDLKYKGMTKSERQLTEMFYYRFPDIPLLERMQAVMDYVVDEYETLIGRDLGDDEIEIVRGKFMKMYRSTDLYVLYNWFLKEYGYETLPQVSYEKRFLKYEDVYPMLYLKYLLKSRRMDRNIRHLVIDEMQDYSYMQYLILDKMFSCKMTILGDKAQTMEEKTRDVLSFLPRVFGRGIRKINMNKSYRNTMEIASYANSISDVSDMELFERHGKPVEEQTFSDRKAALEAVLEKLRLEEFETAAVIEMTQERAKKSAAYLKERMEELGMDTENRFSVVDRDSTHFKKGLTVTTFYLAKGLEFDQVFALYTTQDNTPLHRQARYICATRALHELYMYEVKASQD